MDEIASPGQRLLPTLDPPALAVRRPRRLPRPPASSCTGTDVRRARLPDGRLTATPGPDLSHAERLARLPGNITPPATVEE